jgi:type IV secretory pathway TraG/TraD family ATPase VirD4
MRDVNVRLWSYAQNYLQLTQMFGVDGAQEMLSACALQVFGCSDPGTRQMIRDRLGQTTIRRHTPGGGVHNEVTPLVSDDAIDRELRVSSPLQYVIAPHLPPMRLGRVAHKALVTKEGLRLEGLPLEGHYDEKPEVADDEE